MDSAPITLDGVELRVLHLPLVAPFTTSFGTETVREVIVARALTPDGDGWGEIVTSAAPLYSSEYTQGAWDVALRWMIPALLDARQMSPAEVSGILEPFVGHRMVKAGLELAVLDASLRLDGISLGAHLGVTRDRVPSGVSVGIQRDPTALVDVVGGYLDEGYARIKIKIKPGRDVDDTAAVREWGLSGRAIPGRRWAGRRPPVSRRGTNRAIVPACRSRRVCGGMVPIGLGRRWS